MGRIYFDPEQGGRPDPLTVDEQAIARGVQAAYAVADARMAQAAQFIVENGHQVSAGHGPVGSPGDIGSDPDIYPDAADL
jgi:hypothetical protein